MSLYDRAGTETSAGNWQATEDPYAAGRRRAVEAVLEAALREVYDGATPLEASALRDALADRGYRIERIT